MIKTTILLLLTLLCQHSIAQEGKRFPLASEFKQLTSVSFRLNQVKLSEFTRLVLSDILRKSFVIDQALNESKIAVTLDLNDLTPAQVDDVLKNLLDQHGYGYQDIGGVRHIRPKAVISKTLVYRPSNRSVQYLMDLAGPFFQPQGFANFRAIRQDSQDKQQDGQDKQQGQETGTNALSLIDRTQRDTIVYSGTQDQVSKLESLLQQLDQPAHEVVVKASVFEVRQSQTDSSAVSLALGLLKSASGLGISITQGTDKGNAIKIKAGDISAVWSALTSDNRFRLFSSPTVRIKSGSSARFMAGSEVPVLASTTTTNTGTVQSVEYKSAGVILKLTPHVRSGGTELDISQEVSSFTETTNGVNNSPTLLKRELNTSITAGEDEIIILGGLEETSTTAGTSGLSFFPSWLHGDTSSQDRTEIMMILNVQRI
ncbi:type II secretion system protein GspD [Azovibrio restrictus]|uniref:type II secretion system protein GspD n=1 Tax=Azovibrio restrictus TaxID=146938 RepID=UPI0026EED719|nr:hypothetical protein [Azovibrio restrictus]MDD3482997.1 hypothetical protein [Azovibrio restrictus]